MAETKVLNVRFQQKFDTAENWADSELVLMAGEMAIESDTNKFKFGDGEHVYSELPYAGIDQAQLDATNDSFTKLTPEDDVTDAQALADIAAPKQGDIAVIERVIGGVSSASSMTAYMYDGEKWCALDGNYDASNVYTSSKITLAGNYGSFKDSRGDTVSITQIGNKKIGDEIAAGTSLQSILMDILSQRLQPSASNPSAAVVLTNSGNNGGNISVEIGTSYTPQYRTTFSAGSFSYGPATGCTSTAASVQVVGVDSTKVDIAANALNGASGSLPAYTVADATARKLRVTYGWTASTGTPIDNLGDAATNGTKIDAASGKTADSSHTITGYRNYWYGFIGSTDYSTISRDSSTNVCGDGTKNLTAGNAAITAKTLPTITAVAGDRMPVVVMPTAAGKKVSSASMPSSLNAPVTFTKLGTVSLKGLDGYGDAVSYDVWGYVADDMPVGADFSIVIA